jgi:hypothetical protein
LVKFAAKELLMKPRERPLLSLAHMRAVNLIMFLLPLLL